jgi:plasmid stabilization system protein ParE
MIFKRNQPIVAAQVEAELDEIWLHIATESGSPELAGRVIDSITRRFYLLARNPYPGRSRGSDLSEGLRSFLSDNFVILYRIEGESVQILHVFHGRRDIPGLI